MDNNIKAGGASQFSPEAAAEFFATQVAGQRQEIISAFFAKYGFSPDETVTQVQLGNRFTVVKWDREEYAKARTAVMESKAASELIAAVKVLTGGMAAISLNGEDHEWMISKEAADALIILRDMLKIA